MQSAAADGAELATAEAVAAAAAPAPHERVQVWYRSSAGCPDGAAFIQLLQGLGRPAALAGVGDRVDFVVTMAFTERESSGRLERQSSERTVAIRDFAAASCADVAEVLALSLDLALKPAPAPAPEAEAPASARPAPAQTSPSRLGAQLTLETGLAHAVLPGVALFFDLASARGWGGRLSVRGAYTEHDTDVPLRIGLLAARLEACWAWSSPELGLGPCAGAEIGGVSAQGAGAGGREDQGIWASALGHLRAAWHIGRRVTAEAQLGLEMPFVHYNFQAQTGGTVTNSAALGLSAAVGAGLGF